MTAYPNVKINLGLNVLRKRPDGYHDIETLFVPYFGMTDVLEIVPAESFSIEITSSKPGIPDWNPQSDLCAKAWRLLRDRYGIPSVAISLEKRNPVGGGLGGGSSDGAFTLKMLNGMFSLGLSEAELASLAAELGSDCPFFIHNRPMIGEGRGEILSDFPLPELDFSGAAVPLPGDSAGDSFRDSAGDSPGTPSGDSPGTPSGNSPGTPSGDSPGTPSGDSPVCAFSPKPLSPDGSPARYRLGVIPLDSSLKVSTAQAYSRITPSVPAVGLRDVLSRDITQWRGLLKNDFEPVISAEHPLVRETIESCYAQGCIYAAMSGSGPSVFHISAIRQKA